MQMGLGMGLTKCFIEAIHPAQLWETQDNGFWQTQDDGGWEINI